jgi:hypothetical protein
MNMMLKPEQVKPFLAHSEGIIREFAANYFAKSFSLDPELLPLVLEATRFQDEDSEVDPDDRDAAKQMLKSARNFVQTPETFAEILARYEQADENKFSYGQMLLQAGPGLLEENLSGLEAYPELEKGVQQSVELYRLPTSDIWQKLMDYSVTHADKYVGEFDFNYGEKMVRELAARSDLPLEKMREMLSAELASNGFYKEIYLTMLAGELRDEAWIPVLISKLASDGDLLCKAASDALAKIGTAAAAEAIYERYCKRQGFFSIFAAPLLGQIKTEKAEDAILKLLFTEEDKDDAAVLVDSLGQLLSVRGIPLIRQYIEEGYSSCSISLEKTLYCNCVLNNVEIEDLAEYGKILRDEREEYRQRSAEYQAKVSKTCQAKAEQAVPQVNPEKIGRNDLCPCGSGKKYKKCCGK